MDVCVLWSTGLNRRISTHMCSADCVFLWCASSSLGCFPIYYLRNQNVFVHLGECLQLTPDTLVASVTVTRQEKTSSIKTVFLRFKSSLAIIFCSTVVAFLGLKNTLEFIGYRRFFPSHHRGQRLFWFYPQKSWELIRTKWVRPQELGHSHKLRMPRYLSRWSSFNVQSEFTQPHLCKSVSYMYFQILSSTFNTKRRAPSSAKNTHSFDLCRLDFCRK